MVGDLDLAALVALAGLDELGHRRLLALHRAGGWAAAWEEVRAGRAAELPGVREHWRDGPAGEALAERWAQAAWSVDPAAELDRNRTVGQVLLLGEAAYPARLADAPQPPALLFVRGALAPGWDGTRPSVAIVGTRNATRVGREVAEELGAGLAAAGVDVVSGLALGIDGWAHRGALDAEVEGGGVAERGVPVGVVASGLDIAYPQRHTRLHEEVAEVGLLVSEVPAGHRPAAWRFPARNRIIAGLADAVVVVESRHRGGSMHTARAAEQLGVDLLAVPGSVRAPASAGTNQLLLEGATPVVAVEDVLVAIGRGGTATRGRADARPADPVDRAVLDALGWEPLTFAELVERSPEPAPATAAAVARLEDGGWLEREDGWLQRRGRHRA